MINITVLLRRGCIFEIVVKMRRPVRLRIFAYGSELLPMAKAALRASGFSSGSKKPRCARPDFLPVSFGIFTSFFIRNESTASLRLAVVDSPWSGKARPADLSEFMPTAKTALCAAGFFRCADGFLSATLLKKG